MTKLLVGRFPPKASCCCTHVSSVTLTTTPITSDNLYIVYPAISTITTMLRMSTSLKIAWIRSKLIVIIIIIISFMSWIRDSAQFHWDRLVMCTILIGIVRLKLTKQNLPRSIFCSSCQYHSVVYCRRLW